MPKIRRTYKGAAVATTLSTGGVTSATQTSIGLSSSPTTFPTGKFFVVVAPGTAQEEKMCVTLSGSTLTVVDPNVTSTAASVNGRGVDNTTARSSIAGGATVYPVATAIDFDEANELTSKYATQGSIVYQGASTFAELAIGTAGYALKVNSGATAPEWGQIGTAGIADNAVTGAKLDATVAGNGLNGGGGSALSVNVDSSTIEINSDTLRVKDLGITTAKLNDLAVTEDKIAANAVTTGKIADGAILNADINASAAIALSKLATSTAANIIVHNSGGVPTAVALSGDATISNTGALTIANDAILTAKIKDGEITAAKFASTLAPVYIKSSTTGLPTTDGTIAYINTGTSTEGIQTYNGVDWTKPWNMPWGEVLVNTLSSAYTTSGTTELDLNSDSITLYGNRRYKLTWSGSWYSSAGTADAFDFRFYVNAVQVGNPFRVQGAASNIYVPSATYVAYYTTPNAAVQLGKTAKVTVKRAAGTGTLTVVGSSYTSYFIIEDMGPAGAPV